MGFFFCLFSSSGGILGGYFPFLFFSSGGYFGLGNVSFAWEVLTFQFLRATNLGLFYLISERAARSEMHVFLCFDAQRHV